MRPLARMRVALPAPLALVALVLGVLLPVGCNTAPPRDHIIFSHGPHLARGANCTDCHGRAIGELRTSPLGQGGLGQGGLGQGGLGQGAEGTTDMDAGVAMDASSSHAGPDHSERVEALRGHPVIAGQGSIAARPLLPTEEECLACHDNPERDRCAYCHTVPGAAQTYEEASNDIRFDHAGHDAPRNGDCVSCHGGTTRSLASFEAVMPPMEACTGSCHQEQMRALECSQCHDDLGRYTLAELSIIDHGPGFLRRHGTPARADTQLCAQCHEPTFCGDCHLASPGLPLEVLDPTLVHREFVHRGDYTARHSIEADLERGTCVRCHGTSFCDDCHRLSGIGGGVALDSPHPPGWLDPLSSFGHARSARRDLLSCVSCHESDAETTCVPCHRVGGVAGNPHPPGFGGGNDPLAHGVCRACHVPR